jgi:hypothetical protein
LLSDNVYLCFFGACLLGAVFGVLKQCFGVFDKGFFGTCVESDFGSAHRATDELDFGIAGDFKEAGFVVQKRLLSFGLVLLVMGLHMAMRFNAKDGTLVGIENKKLITAQLHVLAAYMRIFAIDAFVFVAEHLKVVGGYFNFFGRRRTGSEKQDEHPKVAHGVSSVGRVVGVGFKKKSAINLLC